MEPISLAASLLVLVSASSLFVEKTFRLVEGINQLREASRDPRFKAVRATLFRETLRLERWNAYVKQLGQD